MHQWLGIGSGLGLGLANPKPNPHKGPGSALQHVDAFVCNHPPALCELYMPFNKSILVIASVRA